MSKIIWLKTAKVMGTDSDGLGIIQFTTIKLESVNSFPKFIEHIHLHGLMMAKNPPTVIKVTENEIEIDEIDKYQKVVADHLIKSKAPVIVDYKKEFEKTNDTNKKLTDRLGALEDLIKGMQNKPIEKSLERLSLEDKANELDIKFRADISDEKLKEKINNVEK
jgi:hypothetical protein